MNVPSDHLGYKLKKVSGCYLFEFEFSFLYILFTIVDWMTLTLDRIMGCFSMINHSTLQKLMFINWYLCACEVVQHLCCAPIIVRICATEKHPINTVHPEPEVWERCLFSFALLHVSVFRGISFHNTCH